MTYGDCVRASITALKANLLRSILTSLGIIIGISSVIAMVAIGAGAESRVKESIESLGANIMIVLNGSRTTGGARGGTGSNITLTEEDAQALQRDVPSVEVAAGDALVFAQNGGLRTVRVEALGVRRGPAAEARQLYRELSDDPLA